MTFRYPPKEGSLTKVFVDFVKNNPGKTRKEFYDYIKKRNHTPSNLPTLLSLFYSEIPLVPRPPTLKRRCFELLRNLPQIQGEGN